MASHCNSVLSRLRYMPNDSIRNSFRQAFYSGKCIRMPSSKDRNCYRLQSGRTLKCRNKFLVKYCVNLHQSIMTLIQYIDVGFCLPVHFKPFDVLLGTLKTLAAHRLSSLIQFSILYLQPLSFFLVHRSLSLLIPT